MKAAIYRVAKHPAAISIKNTVLSIAGSVITTIQQGNVPYLFLLHVTGSQNLLMSVTIVPIKEAVL